MAKYCIGIDLGGTYIKFGLLDSDLQHAPIFQLPTPCDWGSDGVIEQMVAGARRAMEVNGLTSADIVGVGIGSPGPLNLTEGVVVSLPNIPGMENVRLRDIISQRLNLPAALENDANAAAFGEFLCGAGKGHEDIVMLTLGTGVGSGIVINGEIFHGDNEMGGELGHMIVQPKGEPCKCGQHGCLEVYASASYIAERTTKLIAGGRHSSMASIIQNKKKITARDINEARKAGDKLAAEMWDSCAFYIALGCVNVCRLLDPDRIIIGGGLAAAGTELLNPVLHHFSALHWKITPPATDIVIGYLAGDAGAIGAAGMAWAAIGNMDFAPGGDRPN